MSNLKLVTVRPPRPGASGADQTEKALVIALSLVAGLILGLFIALVRHFVLTRRETVPYSSLEDGRFSRRERKDDQPLP